jgi:dephospho-CoA kinase
MTKPELSPASMPKRPKLTKSAANIVISNHGDIADTMHQVHHYWQAIFSSR